MINIIFGPPGAGKTCLLAHIANVIAFDSVRNRRMQQAIMDKQAKGFASLKTLPTHCVSSNFDLTLRKFRYDARPSRRINPYRLGFNNPDVETHFNIPFEAIFITEAQKYLNSRMSRYFPDWQSRWYEQHRHNDLDIWLDTQRPMLIDVNIRELSQFVEIVNLNIDYDQYGRPCRLKWLVRRIANSSLFDKYMASGKKDDSCYTEEVIVANYNVFALYDSQNCKPKFYQGHFDSDYDYKLAELTEDTAEGYIKFLKEFDDELPQKFYNKKVA